ncbi:MAG: TonB-dependent receptor, partial [Bacteroidota bacterium]
SYTVEASYIGYEPQRKDVTVDANDKVTLDFTISQGVLLGDVIVTGTRSRPRTTISSPVPVDNFPAVTLDRQGNGDITENLKNLVPSFNATPLTGDGSAFVRPTSLRGLPPDETLIMVNSKRRHRSSLIAHFGAAMNVGAHAVDIGMIPSIAVKNLEVLRDGAAAQYGSDAIAGVMNFILKDNSRGVEFQAQTGKWYGNPMAPDELQRSETDYKVALNVGLPLTNKGFFNFSAEYVFNEELSRGVQHASAIGVPGAQNPAMNWGRPESSGLRTVWNAGIEIADNVEFYSFGNFADTYGNYSFFYRAPGRSGVLIPLPNNPNDPSEGNFCWCDEFPAGFTPRLEGFQSDFSSITGIRGQLGSSGVNYDVSASFGRNRINYVLNGSLNPSWGPYSQTVFEPGDLQQNENNFNVDLSKDFSDRVRLAAGFQTRREVYTMYVGDEQSFAAGPWAGVSRFINPETGENYSEPSIGANGLAGTSREAAGEFEGTSW